MDFENLWTSTHPKNLPENLHWCLFPPPPRPPWNSRKLLSPLLREATALDTIPGSALATCEKKKKLIENLFQQQTHGAWYVLFQKKISLIYRYPGICLSLLLRFLVYSHGMFWGGVQRTSGHQSRWCLEDSGMLSTNPRAPREVACSFWRGVVRMAITKDLLRSYFHVPWV